VASRLSTGGGVEGGGGVEAEHWVKGEEGGDDIGVEAGKRQRRQRRWRDWGLRGVGKLGSLTASQGNSPGLGFAGPGGPNLYPSHFSYRLN
jgi:hypothetical protein